MKNPIFLAIALTASTLAANAQSPVDTLQDVRPFSTHALDLLMAREPGVEVISSPGAPGMTPTIHVRGLGVIPGIEPIYVVDGMRRRNLDGIAPESIEKIEVLKNAAAMGLWGPDAAAGVVVVTTRRASQKGFHAGYEFAGGIQSLAHVPERMTLEDWHNSNQFIGTKSDKREHSSIETSFLQKHHLFAQYGGDKLSAYAGFSVLDNDGPYSGKVDTHRRYAASWSAEYRPLQWLSLETIGRWNQSSISRAPQSWVKDYLLMVPADKILSYSLRTDQDKLSETAVQGRINIYPLPGLYVRGTVGYAQGMKNLRKTAWTDVISEDSNDYMEGRAGHDGKKWFQWGVEAGWSGQWKGHRLRFDGTFRRMKVNNDTQILRGTIQLADYGLSFGDDAGFEEKFLLPRYEIFKTLDEKGKLGFLDENPGFYPYLIDTREMKWKESVLSVGYDWKNRYEVDFSYYRSWEEKLFSSEGWRVPAVTLGWTLSEEPILRRLLPESLKHWSINASWSNTDNYIPIFDTLIFDSNARWIGPSSSRSTAARHRDLTTSLSFQFGGPTLDLSASWYVNDDDLTDHYSYYVFYSDNPEPQGVSGENLAYTVRNQGVELSGALRQNVGPFRYSLSAFLTFYENRVRFGESYQKAYYSVPWQDGSPLAIKDGERIGGAYLYPVTENTIQISWDDRVWKGSVFPKVTGGIQASLGWNRWQLTVSGHGDSGQTIRNDESFNALQRYYLKENPMNLQQETTFIYSSRDFANSEYAVLDASFFRIDQIRLDYTLPLRNVRLNLFASLENWFLFTKYPGSDPELALVWDVLERNVGTRSFESRIGIETATYPSTRRTIFGLSINF